MNAYTGWLRPEIVEPLKEEKPLNHAQVGDKAVIIVINVPGHGSFLVAKPDEGDVREEFINGICQHLYGDVYDWRRG